VDTLKTAIVVVLLLAVLYGVYVTLNQPDQDIPEDIAWAQQQTAAPLQVDFGGATENVSPGVTASLGDSSPWSSEPTNGDSHAHSAHDMVPVQPPTAPAMTQAVPEMASQAGTNRVAAPELITSSSDNSPQTLEPVGQNPGTQIPSAQNHGEGSEHYASSVPAGSDGTQAAPSDSNSYPNSNSFPPNAVEDSTESQSPAFDSNTSIYAPPSNAGAPTGGYGESPELTGNQGMVAATEPPVAESYAAPDSSVTPVGISSQAESAIQKAEEQIAQQQFYEALYTLSLAYNAPGMTAADNQKLQQWLDPLAGKVIYSQEHLIGNAYEVNTGETMASVAAKYNVPWQLLANINGLRDPAAMKAGTRLKVVPGPFHAEIDTSTKTLTLFAGRLYAGQFSINISGTNPPALGEYKIADKQPGHSFYAGNAQTIAPQDPENPFGNVWMDLGNNVAIHGTSNSPGQSERLGCISLANKDANDLYGILSLGSNVIVR